jgi:hypothetical protein
MSLPGNEIVRDFPLNPEVAEEIIGLDQLFQVGADVSDTEHLARHMGNS